MAEWPGTPDPPSVWPGTPDPVPTTASAWPGTPDEPPAATSLLDYPLEVGKEFLAGAGSTIGARLQGIGARQAATEQITGQRLDESMLGAMLQGRLPNVIQETEIPKRAASETGPYKAGEAVSAATQFPSRDILHPVVRDVSRALGSVGTNIGLTVLNPPIGIATTFAEGPGEQAERITQARAKGAKISPEQEDQATSLAIGASATEFADLLLTKLGSVGAAMGFVKRLGARALVGAGTQGTQEYVQQVIQNAIEKNVYNPQRDYTEGATYNALIGAIAGGIVGGGMAGRRQENVRPGTEAEAYAATISGGTEPTPATPTTPGPMDQSAPVPAAEMVEPTSIPVPADPAAAPEQPTVAPTSATPTPEIDKVIPIPSEMQSPEPMVSEAPQPGLYRGTFGSHETQKMLTRNLQRLINYQIALADPEVQRLPDQLKHLQEQLPILQQEIIEQRRFLGITAPTTPQPKLLPPPPSITPTEVAAGIEQPPRDLGPAPVIVNVPEEVNVAAARIVQLNPPNPKYPRIPYESSVDEFLGKPLDLTDEQTRAVAANWGLLRYTLYDSQGGRVYTTGAFNLSPGQEPTGVRLKIPQDDIDPRNIILHSNTAVSPTGGPLVPDGPRVDIVEAATAKFGQRFHDYVYSMGQHFIALRNAVASIPGPTVSPTHLSVPRDYTGLLSEGIGISFITDAHGIRISVPFAASFINIAMPMSTNPREAAQSFAYTMLHELSHHTHRSETRIDDVISEMVDHLNSHPNFNPQAFAEGLTATVTQHHDVMLWLRGLYEDGYVETIGERLPIRPDQGGGGRSPSDLGNFTDGTGQRWGSKISDWTKIGPSRAGGVTDGRVGSATLARVGGHSSNPDYGSSANARALRTEAGHSDVDAYQRTGATAPIRNAIGRIFGGNTPPSVQAQAAHADKINWLYQYSAGLLELRQANQRFTPLVKYTEIVQLRDMEESRWQDRGVAISKAWRSLGQKKGDILANFLNDLANMVYLTPQERAQGVKRWPTAQEFAQLSAKHKPDAKVLGVYRDVMQHFHAGLQLESQSAIDHAMRTITDPIKLSDAVSQIRAWEANLKSVPYFPFMRFGSHFITVRNPVTNGVEFFELYERHGLKSAKKVQEDALRKIRTQFPTFPDSAFKWGVLPPDVSPLHGLSPQLLEHMKQKMQLSQAQLDALEQLQYQMSPALSFKHRFQHKGYVPGYSRDFLRAFAHWSFHNARYHANTKYIWELEERIKEAGQYNGDKATRIRNYMIDHLQNTLLNTRGDHGKLRGIAFFYHLGFSAASAFYNLYSLPTNAWSHLASHYGNVRATKAMLKAIAEVSTFYQRGNLYNATDFQLRALGYGILTGRVSETQAAELAGLANGNGLIFGVAGNKTQRAIQWAQESSAFFFENAEQFVRRVTYRAALDLAMKNPTNKGVQQAVGFSPREQQNLVAGVNTGPSRHSYSPQEANAIVYANETVDRTAYVYKRWAKPRVMRHPIGGNVLIFYRFIQAMVYAFLNGDRGYRSRWLITSLAVGGLMAIPGYEELKGILQALLKQFGHNVDIDTEMGRHILQWTDGTVPPDIILHGNARRGFHVPAILDMMGSYATGRPGRGYLEPGPGVNVSFPMLDLSKGATPKLFPVDIGKLMTPYQSTDRAVAEASQRAAGAAFSPAFNLYNALMNSKMEADDFKRWERVLPRAFAGMSKSIRVYAEERERAPRGGPAGAKTQLNYDVRDPEQLMEIIFQGLGYTTLRQSREWDFKKAEIEHTTFVKGSRQGIMEQFYEAMMSQDPKEMESVSDDIAKYNERVKGTPDAAYAITEEGLKTSLRNRVQEKTLDEAGLAREKRKIPVIRDLREVYPKAVGDKVIDVQRR